MIFLEVASHQHTSPYPKQSSWILQLKQPKVALSSMIFLRLSSHHYSPPHPQTKSDLQIFNHQMHFFVPMIVLRLSPNHHSSPYHQQSYLILTFKQPQVALFFYYFPGAFFPPPFNTISKTKVSDS